MRRSLVSTYVRTSLALAGALLLAAPGCRTLGTRPPAVTPSAGAGSGAASAGADAVPTGFQVKLEADENVKVHLDLARSYKAQGNYETAVYEYRRAVEDADGPGRHHGESAAPQQALAHRRIAAALDRLGRFAQAEVHYGEALKLSPKDPEVWNDAGYSAYLQHRWDEADRRLRTAARLAPDDPRIQTNLGLCLAAAGKTDEALIALSRTGGPAIGHANLAICWPRSARPTRPGIITRSP